MFREDWLGLQRLGARLRFLVSPGQHVSDSVGEWLVSFLAVTMIVLGSTLQMEISDDFLETEIIHPYLASPETSAASIPAISAPRFISQP